jgi:hypothetical protein
MRLPGNFSFTRHLCFDVLGKIIPQQILRAPYWKADFVNAEILVSVMNIAQHPQIVLGMIHPVANLLLVEWLLIVPSGIVRVTVC